MNAHLTVYWSVKGGQGTTVTAAALALTVAGRGQAVDLIDHPGGDLSAVFNVAPPRQPAHSMAEALTGSVSISDHLRLIDIDVDDPATQSELLAHIERSYDLRRHVIVDAGLVDHWTPGGGAAEQLAARAGRSYCVIRNCYLAVRRLAVSGQRPTGVIVITTPGRALTARDVAAVSTAPIIAELHDDPAIARTVDSGLFLPRVLPHFGAGLTQAVLAHRLTRPSRASADTAAGQVRVPDVAADGGGRESASAGARQAPRSSGPSPAG